MNCRLLRLLSTSISSNFVSSLESYHRKQCTDLAHCCCALHARGDDKLGLKRPRLRTGTEAGDVNSARKLFLFQA